MDSLDDLDNALFGRSFDSKEFRASTANETKKKVVFKDSDANDPLGDLNLSDDEDFQESVKESLDIRKDNKIANLFGIKSEGQGEPDDSSLKRISSLSNKGPIQKPIQQGSVLKESDFLGTPDSPVLKSDKPVQKTAPKMKSLFDDDDDIVSNLADKAKSSTSSQSKKSMLMEDLFGSRSKSSSGVDSIPRKNSLNFDPIPARSSTGESLSAKVAESTNKAQTSSSFSLSAQKEPRRGRRASAVQNDPLGLLSASNLQLDDILKSDKKYSEVKPTAVETSQKSASAEDLPEWLGGPKIPKDQKQELEKVQSDGLASAKSTESMKKSSTDLTSTIPAESAEQSGLAAKLLGIEFDQQAAMMSMQQQEHELRTAAALAQQSGQLNYLLESQRAKLVEQERQFGALMARQLDRQALLDAQMKAQQERIDHYIKTLAAQPSSVPPMHLTVDKGVKLDHKESVDEGAESECLLQKLQLEKLYLENTLDSLKEKHEKEISIVEDSYKKQVTFLEEAMVQMEKRMQDDAESLEADYKLKIQRLKEELSENHKAYMADKEVLKEENTKLIQEIREHHSRSLAVLQKEHTETIERITQSKESERRALEIMRTEGTSVQNVLNRSQLIVEGLEDLRKKFEGRDSGFVESQGHHLQFQEKNIEYLKESLEKQKNEFMEEKQRLMETIRNLEANIAELTREFRAQSTSFKEGEEILKSREQALLRDREIFVEQTSWERERLQAMRDTWSKEHDMQLEWLAQERQALAAEKGKLQIYNKLKIGADESSKAELEATMRAAQEAATSASQERLRWQEKTRELELQQNALQDQEARLVRKAKELQEFTQSAIAKREEGLRALKEAHFIEERYKEKLNQLQLQQEILAQREGKLAAQKLELARERLALRAGEDRPVKDTVGQDDGVSYADGQPSLSDAPSRNKCTTYFKDIVDPHLILLKWDLNSKSEMSSGFPVNSSHSSVVI